MSRPNRSETPRGFAIYDQFTDAYGHSVRVQESSAARYPAVWIFSSGSNGECGTPHLTIEQAARMRDALSVFIAERGQEQEADS